MAHWFKKLFAEIGDKTAIPDLTDPSGYVSYETGYGVDYGRSFSTDPLAKAIERQKMNQVLNDVTGAVQQYQTHGFPDYIDATTNGGTAYAYALNAIVRFTDGVNYQNTVAGNTNAPNVSGWAPYGTQLIGTIAALRLTPYSGQSIVSVTGYYTALDNIGVREYFWDSVSVEADNGGTTIQVTGVVTGRWKMKVDGAVNVDWFGARALDATISIQSALNAYSLVECSKSTTYNLSAPLVVPDYCTFYGSGETTVINVTNDNVAISIKAFCDVYKFKVTKSGAHTKNLVEVGSLTYGGSRSSIHDMYITGAGNDGLQIRDGNLGTISNIVSVFNGRDGINFTTETQNNNAWVISGMNDLRSNGRDGFHLAMGASSGDAYAPKSNSANMITAQENGRYGVYVGTRSNNLVVYSEGNTAIGNVVNQIFLDTYAAGNYIVSTEAKITDNSSEPAGNYCLYSYGGAGYNLLPHTKVKFAGGSGKGIRISNDDSTAGYIDFEKTSAGNYSFSTSGYSADQLTTFTNSGYPTYGHNILLKGYLQPNSIKINDDIATNKIEFLNTTTTGKLSLYKSAANTYYFETSASTGGQNVYFNSAAGDTNWRFGGLTVPTIDNTYSLGVGSLRWSVIYAATGTINTSDERLKTFLDIEIAEVECAKAIKSMIRKYKFNDSIMAKGLDARIHFGVGAQSVITKMKEFGLDPMQYGFICYDAWGETAETRDMDGNILQAYIPAGDRYGIRYEELLCFIISAM